MERYLQRYGFSVQKITYGMKDVQQIEAVASNQGDVPTNADDMVATLPEAPDVIEVDSKKD